MTAQIGMIADKLENLGEATLETTEAGTSEFKVLSRKVDLRLRRAGFTTSSLLLASSLIQLGIILSTCFSLSSRSSESRNPRFASEPMCRPRRPFEGSIRWKRMDIFGKPRIRSISGVGLFR